MSAEQLRAQQSAAFVAEDFARYFAVSEQLAAEAPAFARSHEYALHVAFHTLVRLTSGLRFLQIGAMDGKRFDPVYAFVRHYRWRGLILEPLPDLFAALSAHYADHPGAILVNAALTPTDGPRTMMRVSRQAVADGVVPLWAEGLGSLHPERNALGGVGVDAGLHAALLAHATHDPVRGVTLKTLLAEHPLPRLDLLQIDAEGCELDIVAQACAENLRPAAIHLEHWALTPADRAALVALLAERGYTMRMSVSDLLALNPTLRAAIDEAAGWPC